MLAIPSSTARTGVMSRTDSTRILEFLLVIHSEYVSIRLFNRVAAVEEKACVIPVVGVLRPKCSDCFGVLRVERCNECLRGCPDRSEIALVGMCGAYYCSQKAAQAVTTSHFSFLTLFVVDSRMKQKLKPIPLKRCPGLPGTNPPS